MDSFVEQLVKRKITREDYAVRIIVVILTLTIPFAVFFVSVLANALSFITLAFALLMIGIYMIFYVIQNQRVEYEYEITNDNITVDKSINKNKRKNVCSLTISHIALFCHIDDKKLANKKFAKRFDVSVDIMDKGNYVACFNAKQFGDCCLIMTPNSEAIEAIVRFLPAQQKQEFKLAQLEAKKTEKN